MKPSTVDQLKSAFANVQAIHDILWMRLLHPQSRHGGRKSSELGEGLFESVRYACSAPIKFNSQRHKTHS